MKDRRTVGFGVPDEMDPHHFAVEIPAGRADAVVITEHFGLRGGADGIPELIERCHLPRQAWSTIAEEAKRVLNERLKEKGLTASRWSVGANKVERLLGRELCVLAWAVEAAQRDLIPGAIRNWASLRPEERWWLFSMATSMTGTAEDVDIGWRKAIRIAMTENPTGEEVTSNRATRRRQIAEAERPSLPLFDIPGSEKP